MSARRATTIPVSSAAGRYRVLFDRGGLDRLGTHLRAVADSHRVVVVSDAHVAALYGKRALASLGRARFAADLIAIRPGERSKSLDTMRGLYGQFAELALDRATTVVALGGGVVGDVAGFAAATYLRGLPLVHVPTTVLAQADSSIGGKTGVDLPGGKNLVGAFHAPRLVLSDVETLGTLEPREAWSGLAEVAKVAFTLEPRLLSLLEKEGAGFADYHPELLQRALTLAARAKAKVVSADERESGRRMVLNYGHTVGHALEAMGGYRRWLHGEAVAHGIQAAARLATMSKEGSAEWESRQFEVLRRLGHGRKFPPVSISKLLEFMALDKKARARAPAFVLTARVGVVRVRRSLSRELVVRALASLGARP